MAPAPGDVRVQGNSSHKESAAAVGIECPLQVVCLPLNLVQHRLHHLIGLQSERTRTATTSVSITTPLENGYNSFPPVQNDRYTSNALGSPSPGVALGLHHFITAHLIRCVSG